VYGGIHWQFDNPAGLIAGRQVGQFVADRLLRPRGLGNAAVHAPPFHDCNGGDREPAVSVDAPHHRDDADDLKSLLTRHESLTS
jgi:hypothetical protein